MVLQNVKMIGPKSHLTRTILIVLTLGLLMLGGCAKRPVRNVMETTAYCGCSACCSWERGNRAYLKLDFWNRYVSGGAQTGQPYSGRTASGSKPHEPQPGLFSIDSVERPWMIPFRVLPWSLLPDEGTIAADTRYYPFGTRMYVPGYGWGRVEDRGGAIKGKNRIDLYFKSHEEALHWGRRKLHVQVQYP